MSITDSLIADYLKRKGFTDTLHSFKREAHLSSTTPLHYEPLESIVQDRLKYKELSLESFQDSSEGINANDFIPNAHLFENWSIPSPSIPSELLSNQLIIHTSYSKFIINNDDHNDNDNDNDNNNVKKILFTSSSNKSLNLIDLSTKSIISTLTGLHNCVIKCTIPIPNTNQFIICGMDGLIKLFELTDNNNNVKLQSQLQLHKRLITDVKLYIDNNGKIYLISIGYDKTLKISEITKNNEIEIKSTFNLLSNSTSITIGQTGNNNSGNNNNNNNQLIIFLTRLDSTQLSIFTYQAISSKLIELCRISLNDAEFSNHGFTPMSISLSNSNNNNDDDYTNIINSNTYLAIGTNHIPYMRLIVIKLPNFDELFQNINNFNDDDENSLEQKLISTSIYRGLILGNYNTLSPQDKYSQGIISWRSGNSTGIWISGDDGKIRGLNLQNGEIIELNQKHNQRIKCLKSLNINGNEIIITSSIDKKLIYWE